MANLFSMKQEREAALAKAENIIATAERAKRNMTEQETKDCDAAMAEVHALNPQIDGIERQNTLQKHLRGGKLIPGTPTGEGRKFQKPQTVTLSDEYPDAFYSWLQSGGKQISAALYEGSNSAGGFVVPSVVDQQIVPLAPQESAVRQLATVMATTMDVKIPIKASFGNVAIKAESGSSTNLFTESDPTLSEKTLSAYMTGGVHTCSWELLQDVPSFQAFAIDDLLLAQTQFEENLNVNGTGTGQAEGLLTNVDNGVAAATADGSGNLLSIDATFDLMGTLKAMYHPGASWLMSRASGIALRKAQKQANLFEPVFTRVGTQDYLHGYPVFYSGYMPAIAAGATPVVFGDFKRAYVIGDRGGSGINVKILDQPLATAGQIQLLAYRRMDGRVRRSEACKSLTLHT